MEKLGLLMLSSKVRGFNNIQCAGSIHFTPKQEKAAKVRELIQLSGFLGS